MTEKKKFEKPCLKELEVKNGKFNIKGELYTMTEILNYPYREDSEYLSKQSCKSEKIKDRIHLS